MEGVNYLRHNAIISPSPRFGKQVLTRWHAGLPEIRGSVWPTPPLSSSKAVALLDKELPVCIFICDAHD